MKTSHSTVSQRGAERTIGLLCWYAFACLAIGQLVAYFGNSFFGHDWDKDLIKPSVTQFNWVFFVVVWTINYSVMGVAAGLIRQSGRNAATIQALRWFWCQYGLCLLWIPVVHGTGWVGSAVIMDFLVGIPAFITGFQFLKISRPAFWWFFPYLVWTVITTHAKIWMYCVNS